MKHEHKGEHGWAIREWLGYDWYQPRTDEGANIFPSIYENKEAAEDVVAGWADVRHLRVFEVCQSSTVKGDTYLYMCKPPSVAEYKRMQTAAK